MKCSNCKAEINEDSAFCSKCGTKVNINESVKKISLKCSSCDGILTVDDDKSVLACPYCGAKELIIDNDAVAIEKIKASTHKEIEMEKIKSNDRQQLRAEENERKQDEMNQIEEFKKSKWFKFLIGAFLISAIIAFICFSQAHILSGIFATLQAGCFATAWMMGMHIIKEKKRYLHILVAIIGVVLIVPTLKSCNSDSNEANNISDKDWSILFLGDVIPETSSKKFDIHTNTEEELWMDVLKTSEEEYFKYISECKSVGYTNEMKETSIGFDAYNEEGYSLSLSYYSSKEEMSIQIKAPTELSVLDWSAYKISEILPSPKSTVGAVKIDNAEKMEIVIGNTLEEDYFEYCKLCKNNGFTVDAEEKQNSYSSYNTNGYKASLSYNSGNREMCIVLFYPMEFTQITLPTVGISTLLPVPQSLSGKVGSDYDWVYSVYIENMTKNDYEEYVQMCIDTGFDKDTSNYGDSFWADYSDDIRLNVAYEGNDIVYIHISGSLNDDYSAYKRKNNTEIQQTMSPETTVVVTTTSPQTTTTATTTTVTTENTISEISSDYEKAFVRELSNYDVYFMFDTDTKEVVCFGTNDTYVMEGIYSGSFDTGVDVNWINDGWHETFTNIDGSNYATLIDGNGFDWEYKACDVTTAQRVLDDLR